MAQLNEDPPEDRPLDEILRELAFARMIQRGLEDVDQGRTVSHKEVRREVESRSITPKSEAALDCARIHGRGEL